MKQNSEAKSGNTPNSRLRETQEWLLIWLPVTTVSPGRAGEPAETSSLTQVKGLGVREHMSLWWWFPYPPISIHIYRTLRWRGGGATRVYTLIYRTLRWSRG